MYKQGDIVLVRYPFSDKPGEGKLRPAIIVSCKRSNELDHDVLICPITTTLRETLFSFPIKNEHLTTALPKNSEIRCNKITTIRDSLIISKISELRSAPLSELLIKVKQSFDHDLPSAMLADPKITKI